MPGMRGRRLGWTLDAPPRKNDENRGEVARQNKGLILNFFSIEETYDGKILQL